MKKKIEPISAKPLPGKGFEPFVSLNFLLEFSFFTSFKSFKSKKNSGFSSFSRRTVAA